MVEAMNQRTGQLAPLAELVKLILTSMLGGGVRSVAWASLPFRDCFCFGSRCPARKERYGALLVLDETLSFGCLGETGRGLTERQAIPPKQAARALGSSSIEMF